LTSSRQSGSSLPAKFFTDFRRHFFQSYHEIGFPNTESRHFVYAPTALLDVLAPTLETKWPCYQDFKRSAYLLGDANTRIQNVHFGRICRQPVPRKLLKSYPGNRIVEEV
jgi:hypothetical protein